MAMNPRLLRPRASGAFTPRSIAGLALWLDAADSAVLFDATTGGSSVAANGSVARWQDKSGNARHATHGTGNNRPLRKVASLNGRDGVEFDGTNDSLFTQSFTHTVDFTLFVVHKLTSTTQPSFGRIVEHGANTGLAVANLVNPGFYGVQYGSPTTQTDGGAFNTSERLIRYTCDNTATRNLTFSLNGGTPTTLTRTATPTTPAAFFISRFGGAESNYSSQTMFEIVYYGRLLSATEQSAVQNYLRTKWAVY